MSQLILIYHRMTQTGGGDANVHCLALEQFREQMNHLKRTGYRVQSWQQTPASSGHGLQIALTFDDGHRSDIECALILRSLGFDALFFIATGYLGQDGYLQPEDVVELRRLGMKIGSHTHRHVQLTLLGDVDVRDELCRSRAILEELVGHPIEHFSFPGGAYDSRTVSLSRQAGYRYLFTSDWGLNRDAQFATQLLRRTSVLNHLDVEQFDALLRQRNRYARQLAFRTKELMKRTLGLRRYVQIRRTLLTLRKSRLGR